jgi:hypothetical protein
MENGPLGQFGPVAVLFAVEELKVELEVVAIPDHHLVANLALEQIQKLKVVMMLHAYMVRVKFYY